jgi:hypothetical protein
MDPNLFHVEWPQLMEVLAAIVVLAFVTERALALMFEHQLYTEYLAKFQLKELISFSLAFAICWYWHFDIVSVLLRGEQMSLLGEAVTAGVIAGGSKASLKLFRDVLGVRSSAEAARLKKEDKLPLAEQTQ